MSEGEILIIATSAPPDRPGYRRDLLECLCHTEKTRVRFTYRRRWIDEQLLTRTYQGPQQALIVFCDLPEAGNNEAEYSRFIPLRYVNFKGFEPKDYVQRVDKDSYISICFELDRFVNCGKSHITDKFSLWDGWIKSNNKRPLPLPHPRNEEGRFVFTAKNFKEDDTDDPSSSWLDLVEMLSYETSLQKCVFYRIKGFLETNQRNKNKPVHRDLYKPLDQLAWHLKSGHQYRLDLQFYLNPNQAAPPPSLTPRSSTPSIVLCQPIWRTIGIGRDATIFIRSEKIFSEEIASLVVEDPSDSETKSAQVQFLLVIKPTVSLLITAIVLVAIGTLLTAISPEVIRSIFADIKNPINIHAQNITIGIKALAAFFVALGMYLGFKKTPLG